MTVTHGLFGLADTAVFEYKSTDMYDSTQEGGINWDSETINIEWTKVDVLYKTFEK